MTSIRFALVLVLFAVLTGGCCADRTSCNSKADDTAMYQVSPAEYQQMFESRRSEKFSLRSTLPPREHPLQVLVLSGGGSNGAWGAGYMCGWTESGTRPKFDVVTGVSTGALLATGALIEDDAMLRSAYTTTTNSEVQRSRWFFEIPFSDSVRDTRGRLDKRIKHFVTNEKIDKVAQLAAQKRRVFVASVNIDSGRLVIWNLSKMAVDKQYDLYRKAIYASASAPILYPPVLIGGHLHVDGGARASLFFNRFLLPSLTPSSAIRFHNVAGTMPTPPLNPQSQNLYVIVNGEIGLSEACPGDCLIPIVTRTLSCLLDANSIGNLYEAAYFANGFQLNISSIPNGKAVSSFDFDPVEMKQLFDLAEADGKANHWEHNLPNPYGS